MGILPQKVCQSRVDASHTVEVSHFVLSGCPGPPVYAFQLSGSPVMPSSVGSAVTVVVMSS
jgi:hypothetical protein